MPSLDLSCDGRKGKLSPLLTGRHVGVRDDGIGSRFVCLTGLLFFSGGFANPFLFFFYVNLAVAAIILRPMAAWMMTGIAIACVLFLLGDSPAIEGISFPMNRMSPFGPFENRVSGSLLQQAPVS